MIYLDRLRHSIVILPWPCIHELLLTEEFENTFLDTCTVYLESAFSTFTTDILLRKPKSDTKKIQYYFAVKSQILICKGLLC